MVVVNRVETPPFERNEREQLSVIATGVTTEPYPRTTVLWPVRAAPATVVVFGVSRYTGRPPTGRLHAGVTPKIRIPTGHPLSRLRSGLPPLLGACFFPRTRHHALHGSRRSSRPSLPRARR